MVSADMPLKNDDRLTIRLPSDLLTTLEEIQKQHGLNATEIARRCLEQVAAFYRENGYFAFPVKILPEKEFLQNVVRTTEAARLAAVAQEEGEAELAKLTSQKPKAKRCLGQILPFPLSSSSAPS